MPSLNGSRIEELLVFIAVAEAGSFAGGGRSHALTRSAASKAVSRLEDGLGVRLLNRSTRAMSLTPEGTAMLEHGRRILGSIKDAEASLAPRQGSPRGTLRLAAPEGYGRAVVLPLLRSFLSQWPLVQVELTLSDRSIDLIAEGYDLAIRVGRPAVEDSRLISRVVDRFGAVMVASPGYLREKRRPVCPTDLTYHECLTLKVDDRRRDWTIRTDGKWRDLPVYGRIAIDGESAIREAAIAGHGIALLPDLLVGADLTAGRLVALMDDVDFGETELHVVYPTRRLVEQRVRKFIDLLVERAGDRVLPPDLPGPEGDNMTLRSALTAEMLA